MSNGVSGDPGGSVHDPEVAEDYAASVGTDPTPEEINTYLALEGEPPLSAAVGAAEEQAPDPAAGGTVDEDADEDIEAGTPT